MWQVLEGAKEEVQEVVDFLESTPNKYTTLGRENSQGRTC